MANRKLRKHGRRFVHTRIVGESVVVEVAASYMKESCSLLWLCDCVEAYREILAMGKQSARLYSMGFQCERQGSEGDSADNWSKVNLELEQCHPEVHMATLGKDNLLKHLTKNMVESVDVYRVK